MSSEEARSSRAVDDSLPEVAAPVVLKSSDRVVGQNKCLSNMLWNRGPDVVPIVKPGRGAPRKQGSAPLASAVDASATRPPSEAVVLDDALGEVDVEPLEEAAMNDQPPSKRQKNGNDHPIRQHLVPAPDLKDSNGNIRKRVRCEVCKVVLLDNLDTIKKHVGWAKVPGTNPATFAYLDASKNEHQRRLKHKIDSTIKEAGQVAATSATIQQAMQRQLTKADKGAQLAMQATYSLLSHGRPLSALEQQGELMRVSGHQHYVGMHWSRKAASQLSDAITSVLMEQLHKNLSSTDYLALSCDEVTTTNHQSRMSIHVYYVMGFKRFHAMVGLPEILTAPDADTLRQLIFGSVHQRLGLAVSELGSRLVQFSSDGASVLTGRLNGVGKQLKDEAPYLIHLKCTSHGVNLVGNSAAQQPALLMAIAFAIAPATYYCHSTSRLNALRAVQRRLEPAVVPKNPKRNVPTRFISIFRPTQRTWQLYAALVLHAHEALEAAPSCDKTLEFHRHMTDLLGLLFTAGSLPMLLELDCTAKVLQTRNIYLPDAIKRLEKTECKIRSLYLSEKAFTYASFSALQSLTSNAPENKSDRKPGPIVFRRIDGEGQKVAHYKAGTGGSKHYIPLVAKPLPTGRRGRPSALPQTVTRERFAEFEQHVKEGLKAAAEAVIKELNDRFPAHDLLDALGILHPQFYIKGTLEEFDKRLSVLCDHYGVDKQTSSGETVTALVDAKLLKETAPFFFDHAKEIARRIVRGDSYEQPGAGIASSDDEDSDDNDEFGDSGNDVEEDLEDDLSTSESDGEDEEEEDDEEGVFQRQPKRRGKAKTQYEKEAESVSPVESFWQSMLSAKEDAANRVGEFAKLARIMIVMVAGSIEDERLFSAMSYILNKYRCSLRESLEKCVRLMTQDLYTLATFPWARALEVWKEGAPTRGRYTKR